MENEVDLERVTVKLVGGIDETLRPVRFLLWLREPSTSERAECSSCAFRFVLPTHATYH
jgi:hypothetical protein